MTAPRKEREALFAAIALMGKAFASPVDVRPREEFEAGQARRLDEGWHEWRLATAHR